MQSPSPLLTTLVQAGAGTGKTESLARKIITVARYLFEKEGRVPKLVATTFTERATAELRERVLLILSKDKDTPTWLLDFARNSSQLHISTIHGTLSSILHRFGLQMGLDPEFTVMSAQDEKDILGREVRRLLSESDQFKILFEQYTFNELMAVLPELLRQFKTTGECFGPATEWVPLLKEEVGLVAKALESLSNQPVETLAEKTREKILFLQSLAHTLKSVEDPLVFQSEFITKMLRVSKPSIREGGKGFELKEYLNIIFDGKEKLSDSSFSPEINKRHDEVSQLLRDLVCQLAEGIQNQKQKAGFLSFDDLEFLTLELIEKYPDVGKSLQNLWDYWFIDEYQDTSPIQKKILQGFLKTPWNAYFVGDPNQSIYLFRGADQNVFEETRQAVLQQKGLVEGLTTNYRSQPDLLRFMNHLFAQGPQAIPELHSPLQATGKCLTDVHLISDAENVTEEELVLEQVSTWLKQGHQIDDIAVLVRTNDKAKKIGQTLAEAGIPVFVHSSGGFYDRREIQDALALLSFLEDPSQDLHFVTLARSPWVGIPDPTLAEWSQRRGKKTYWEWLCENPGELEFFENLILLEDALEKTYETALSDVLENLLRAFGMYDFCLVGDASGRREANLRKLLLGLKRAEASQDFSASQFIANAWRDFADVGEEIEAASFVEPQRVNIMTIHKSKGLKFNCVIVPYCGDGFLVQSRFLETNPDGRFAIRVLELDSEDKVSPLMHLRLREERAERELQESYRVFYVAITRAAQKLALIAPLKYDSKSWLGFTNLDLAEGVHENEGYRVTAWTIPPEKTAIAKDELQPSLGELEWPANIDAQKQSLSVTEAVQRAHWKDSAIPLKERLEFQIRGRAMHLFFELYRKFPDEPIEKLLRLSKEKFGSRYALDLQKMASTLELKYPPLKAIMAQGHSEWPFIFKEEGISLEGQIDLWGDVGSETWIIDYKSAATSHEEAFQRARLQLELYALALSKFGKSWESMRLAIVSPLAGTARTLSLRSKEEIILHLRQLGSLPRYRQSHSEV